MKKTTLTFLLGFSFVVTAAGLAQDPNKPAVEKSGLQVAKPDDKNAASKFIGFVDANADGVNDRFVDANGDGKNDLGGKEYPHRFKFEDKNKDGVNDLWVDQDGDGVNDMAPSLKGKAAQEIHRNILDADEDSRNDITGETYDPKKRQWHGEHWGFWDESKGKTQGRLIDEDADGIDDRIQAHQRGQTGNHHGDAHRDYFIDEDGDGVCDGRGEVIRMMGRQQQGHHGQNKPGGGHH
jgi:hypothetical protein